MRPIKYRAWDKTEKKMYDLRDMYFNVSIDHPRVVFEMPFEMVDEDWKDHDLVLLAFTGLNDRNGTEIYEGDIITGKDRKFKIKGVVKFKEGCFWCMIPPDDYFEPFPDLMEGYEVEVVGNVFENPGLLKGK